MVKSLLHYHTHGLQSQQGSVLIVSLILLLVMTLLGLSAMQSSLMEETMAGNVKDRNLAFQAAEAALRDADAWLYSLPRAPQTPEVPEEISCNPLSPPAPFENVYAPGTLCDVDSVDYDWSNLAIQYDRLQSGDLGTDHINTCDPDTAPPDDSVFNKQLAAHPCILIEKYDFIPDDMNPDTRAKQIGRQYFRITVLGFGGTSAAQSVIQTILFQRYN